MMGCLNVLSPLKVVVILMDCFLNLVR